MTTTLTNDQITAGAAVLCDHGQPIGRNAAIAVFDAMRAASPQVADIAELPPLPTFMRSHIERAIREVDKPSGMSVHDGMARLNVGYLKRTYELAIAASRRAAQPVDPVQIDDAVVDLLCDHTKLNEDGIDKYAPQIVAILNHVAILPAPAEYFAPSPQIAEKVELPPVAWRYQRDTQAHPGQPDGEWQFRAADKWALDLQGKRLGLTANSSYHCWEALYTGRQLQDAIAASRRAAGGEAADDLAWNKEALARVRAKLESVWDGIREAVEKYSGQPCEGEPFDRLEELLTRLTAATERAAAPADHEIREAVNKLRDVAVQFHAHQSLRDRIASVVLPLVRATHQPSAQDGGEHAEG